MARAVARQARRCHTRLAYAREPSGGGAEARQTCRRKVDPRAEERVLFAFQRQHATVKFDISLHDIETETGATVTPAERGSGLIERLGKSRQDCGLDADARVGNLDADAMRVLSRNFHLDPIAL